LCLCVREVTIKLVSESEGILWHQKTSDASSKAMV